MPSCHVTNKTGVPLNICLKQVTALHFENTVKPNQEVKFKPGRVWFTLEAQVDDGSKSCRYSIMKSAATIGLLAIAVGAVAASAGAALLPASATAGTVAGVATAGSYLSRAGWVARTALVKNAGTIGKILLSIIASPTLSADVRNKATHLLRSLYSAYSHDKTADSGPVGPQPGTAAVSPASASAPLLAASNTYSASTTREAQYLSTELNAAHPETHVEAVPLQSGSILRVHAIYMDRTRHFEIRVNAAGELELWDAKQHRVCVKTAEAERDKAERAEKKRVDKEAKAAKKLQAAQEKERAKKEDQDMEKDKVGWVEWGKAKVGRTAKPGVGATSTTAPGTAAAATDESSASAGEETDDDGDQGESTSVVLDQEKEGEVKVVQRRPTVKERLEGLVHPPPPPAAGVAPPAGPSPSSGQGHPSSGPETQTTSDSRA